MSISSLQSGLPDAVRELDDWCTTHYVHLSGTSVCVSKWFCVGLSRARKRAEQTARDSATVVCGGYGIAAYLIRFTPGPGGAACAGLGALEAGSAARRIGRGSRSIVRR